MENLLLFGILAAAAQIIGYYLYIKNEGIEPNPVTWFMFAYGTAILTVLEWDGNATFAELILPTVCTALAIVVSYLCWRKARKMNPRKWWPEDWWPEHVGDQYAFLSDILITIAYIGAWAIATYGVLSSDTRESWVLVFLYLSNISTFPAFFPIIRSTLKNPKHEHWLPWAVWTFAYALLAYVTYTTHGELWHALMFYPLSNALLHGVMALISHPNYKILKGYVQN